MDSVYYLIIFYQETYVVFQQKRVIWFFETGQCVFVELTNQVFDLILYFLVLAETVDFFTIFGMELEFQFVDEGIPNVLFNHFKVMRHFQIGVNKFGVGMPKFVNSGRNEGVCKGCSRNDQDDCDIGIEGDFQIG